MLRISFLMVVVFWMIFSCHLPPTPMVDLTNKSDSIQLVAPGQISTPLYERDFAINAEGDEIIFTRGDYRQNFRCLVSIKNEEGIWSQGTILPFSGKFQDIEPFFALDGRHLFFASNRPFGQDMENKDYNIWVSEYRDGIWLDPEALDTIINTEGDEFFPSLARSGNLYFTAARKSGIGLEDIYFSEMINGQYQRPQVLDSAINKETYEFNAYISPDENLLVFSSYGREDDLGGGDLYFSKKVNGVWSRSESLVQVNSTKLDYCPFIDYARGNFYFTSERTGDVGEIKSVEDLEVIANQPKNGFGDIYSISLDVLPLK